LIAIAWAVDGRNQLIASCAPVFGRRSTVSQDENVLFACRSACGHRGFAQMRPGHPLSVTIGPAAKGSL
jgi:hypothetical protein